MKTKFLLISLLCIGLLSCETDNKRDNESSNNQENVNGSSDESSNNQENVNGEEGENGSSDENVKYPQGAIKGVFSVSDTKKVAFSQGNLQYQASTDTWRFAANQYDVIGHANENISSTYSGWIDLFGWGTSGWNSGAKAYQPYSTSTTYTDYYPGNSATTNLTHTYAGADWGVYNAISNGGNAKGMWRTLTKDEWVYLFQGREGCNVKYGWATIAGTCKGLIILPDTWTLPDICVFVSGMSANNIYTLEEWKAMEANGAVFLPAAGRRNGTSMNGVGTYGNYWSSTCSSSSSAYNVYFKSGNLYPSGNYYRFSGRSVRLCAEL